MKLYGGSSNSAHSGKHTAKRRKSGFSGLPRPVRILLIALLALALLAAAVLGVVKLLSKPPERPNVQDNQNMNVQTPPPTSDEPEEQPDDDWQLPNKVETEIVVGEDGNEVEVLIPTEVPVSYKDGVYNILVCGTDGDGLRTDTIIIANLNANDHTVSLLSIPRDTLIFGNYTVPKINSSFSVGGVSSLKTQLAKLLGFMVDGYVVVDLEAFIQIVDLVGGVEYDVPQNMYYNDPTQDLYINLQKGPQLLDGEHAMQLVRYRKYASADLQRINVQQDFLKALAKKCVTIGSLAKIQEYAQIVIEYVETDLTLGNMIWFGEELLKCNFDEMKNYTPSGENAWVNGASCYALYSSSILRIVNESFNPYESDLTVYDISVRSAPVYVPPAPTPEPEEEPDTPDEPAEAPDDGTSDDPADPDGEIDYSQPPPGYIFPGSDYTSDWGNQDDWFSPGDDSDPGNLPEDDMDNGSELFPEFDNETDDMIPDAGSTEAPLP